MFESVSSWSLPAHLFLVSGWSAKCGRTAVSCTNHPDHPASPFDGKRPHYRWTDLTYLLHKHHVSWRYYVYNGYEPDCVNGAATCNPTPLRSSVGSTWNPLPYFTTVRMDHQVKNMQGLSRFFAAARTGRLPAVSWVTPTQKVSDHPPALVSSGQSYVTGLINAIMQSPDWKSTAIFLAWDDWGGYYDQVVPPRLDQNGYGLRVPAMVISPYARRGFIDHHTLSFDAYNKFIEDDFLNGQRLNPHTDGRPDPRPDVRESNPLLGNLARDFNFKRKPQPPMILPVCPATDLQPPPTC
jgi:phospholipase C